MKISQNQKHISTVAFASIFALSIFMQLMLFHWQCFHSVIISSLWNDPSEFMLFYLPKVGIAIFAASFVFIIMSRWWTVVVSYLLSIWELAELVYMRANHVPLDSWSITMVDNMEGFWNSVPLYFEPLDWALFGISTLLAIIVLFGGIDKRSPALFTITLIVGLSCNAFTCILTWNKIETAHCSQLSELLLDDEVLPPGAEGHHINFFISPFSLKMERQVYGGSEKYIYDYSALHAFVLVCKSLVINIEGKTTLSSLGEDLFNPEASIPYPDTHLIICLVESLESWALRPDVMPNLWRLKECNNAYFNPSVISEARRGTSADGQMIVETGLLPINGGAVCFRYPDNTFPSISKLFKQGEACALFPHSLSVWNQDEMSPAYGIDLEDNYTCSDDDTILFSKACELAEEYESVLFITGSTHSPFKKVCNKSSLDLPDNMPQYMRDYLKSCNYFDESIGFFVDRILNDEVFQNTTIVITGDHTCFQDEKRSQFKQYCINNNQDYSVENARCPLIIISPKIRENIQNDNDIYQMDIYPTILQLIGCGQYCWKGFGVNIFDDTQISSREFTEEDAFSLSDKIISTNYFSDYSDYLSNN